MGQSYGLEQIFSERDQGAEVMKVEDTAGGRFPKGSFQTNLMDAIKKPLTAGVPGR